MAFTCGFYNAIDLDRTYSATQFGEMFDGLINDGVYSTIGEAFMVVPGSGMTVKVKSGRAWFNKTWSVNTTDFPLDLGLADLLLPRIDTVILEIDTRVSVRNNSLKVIQGYPNTNPVPATLTRSDGLYQYPLAHINVKANATSITKTDITVVVGQSPCPFVTGIIQSVDISDIYQQWEGQFEEWFQNVQNQLSGNVATNLQSQIDQLKTNKLNKADKATQSDVISGTNDTKYLTPLSIKTLTENIPRPGDMVKSIRRLDIESNGKWVKCFGQKVPKINYPNLTDIEERLLYEYPTLKDMDRSRSAFNSSNTKYATAYRESNSSNYISVKVYNYPSDSLNYTVTFPVGKYLYTPFIIYFENRLYIIGTYGNANASGTSPLTVLYDNVGTAKPIYSTSEYMGIVSVLGWHMENGTLIVSLYVYRSSYSGTNKYAIVSFYIHGETVTQYTNAVDLSNSVDENINSNTALYSHPYIYYMRDTTVYKGTVSGTSGSPVNSKDQIHKFFNRSHVFERSDRVISPNGDCQAIIRPVSNNEFELIVVNKNVVSTYKYIPEPNPYEFYDYAAVTLLSKPKVNDDGSVYVYRIIMDLEPLNISKIGTTTVSTPTNPIRKIKEIVKYRINENLAFLEPYKIITGGMLNRMFNGETTLEFYYSYEYPKPGWIMSNLFSVSFKVYRCTSSESATKSDYTDPLVTEKALSVRTQALLTIEPFEDTYILPNELDTYIRVE